MQPQWKHLITRCPARNHNNTNNPKLTYIIKNSLIVSFAKCLKCFKKYDVWRQIAHHKVIYFTFDLYRQFNNPT
eukprot:UN22925